MNNFAQETDSLLVELAFLTGPQIFSETVSRLQEHLGAKIALIGTLRPAESQRLYVQAAKFDGADPSIDAYDICDAPCRRVVETGRPVVVHTRLGTDYPDDQGISVLGSDAYVGCPLLDQAGAAMGIVLLEWTHEISPALAARTLDVLQRLAPRLASEFSRLELQAAIDTVSATPATEPGNSLSRLRQAMLDLAETIQVRSAFVAECLTDDPAHFRFIALARDGEIIEAAEGLILPYEKSPCRNLLEHDEFLLEDNLQDHFPGDPNYEALNLHSYYGIQFRDFEGNQLGHLALMHDRPMSRRIRRSNILKLITHNVRDEMLRYQAEHRRGRDEEALETRRKLESLSVLAATIAHQFNNQLASMIGYTELAKIEIGENHPAANDLQLVEQSMWRARDVISQIMEFAGSATLAQSSEIDINDAIRKTLDRIDPDSRENVEIRQELGEDLPLVHGIAEQLDQVIYGVIMNGLESFVQDPKTLTIRTSFERFEQTDRGECLTGQATDLPDECLLIEVTDNGSGMVPEISSRVFEPFFTTRANRRGLGLAGVLGIVRSMMGSIALNSVPEIGTKISIRLPAIDAQQSCTPPARAVTTPANPAPAGQQKHILVVDDQPEVGATVCRQLAHLGCRTTLVNCGTSAIDLIDGGESFDAALIDIDMPGLDGWQTLRALRQTSDLNAFLMSGHGDAVRTGQSQGLPDIPTILTKPFSMETLRDTLF